MSKLDKLLDKAADHLEPGEQVLAAVQGQHEVKRMGSDTVRAGVLAATDRRLIFYAKKIGGFDFEVFPYDHISSIEMGKNMMGHHVTFFASGNRVHVKWIKKGQDVGQLMEVVKAHLHGGTAHGAAPSPVESAPAAPPPVVTQALDPVDQIRKLASLRDEGLISDEEFEEKKASLLALV